MPQRHPRSLVPPPRRDGASSLLSPKLQAVVYDFLPRSECSLSRSQSWSWRTWASITLVYDFLPRSECSLSLSQSWSWRTWASTTLVYDFLPRSECGSQSWSKQVLADLGFYSSGLRLSSSLGVYSQSWPKQVLADLGVYSSGLRLPSSLGVFSQSWSKQVLADLGFYRLQALVYDIRLSSRGRVPESEAWNVIHRH